MPAKIAILNHGGGTPAVDISVGNSHFARFDFFLYDASGRNPQLIGEGRNDDNLADIFPITNPPLTGLDGFTIFWRAVVSSQLGIPGENYFVAVRVIQDGRITVTDTKEGLLTDPPPKGFIRLQVR